MVLDATGRIPVVCAGRVLFHARVKRFPLCRRVGVACAALFAVFASVLVGCVTISTDGRTLHGDAQGTVAVVSAPCKATGLPGLNSNDESRTLDTTRLRVLTWNVHKTEDNGWREDFARLAANHDLLALQEAVVNDRLRGALAQEGYDWRLTSAFQFLAVEAGVLTAARVPAAGACSLRATEPVTRIPKSALTTTYRLSGSDEKLMVANLHGINFTLGTAAFRNQIEAVAVQLAAHAGPAILAGDFNTWSSERLAVLDEVAGRLGLVAVALSDDHRTRFLGQPVDGMYYRGLQVVTAAAFPVTSSDHNPVSVTFRATSSQLASSH